MSFITFDLTGTEPENVCIDLSTEGPVCFDLTEETDCFNLSVQESKPEKAILHLVPETQVFKKQKPSDTLIDSVRNLFLDDILTFANVKKWLLFRDSRESLIAKFWTLPDHLPKEILFSNTADFLDDALVILRNATESVEIYRFMPFLEHKAVLRSILRPLVWFAKSSTFLSSPHEKIAAKFFPKLIKGVKPHIWKAKFDSLFDRSDWFDKYEWNALTLIISKMN